VGLLLLPLALIAYFVGVFLEFIAAFNRSVAVRRWSTVLFVAAWVLHLGALVQLGIVQGHFPISNLSEYLLTLGWVVLTFHLWLGFRWQLQGLGLVLPPLAALMALMALVLPARDIALPTSHETGWLVFHVSVSTLGMAAFCVAFAMSVIYLVQDRALKSKSAPGLLQRLPSLEVSDRIGHQAILLGFPLLTVGIVTGVVRSVALYDRYWMGGPKETFPVLAWAVFAVLLLARLGWGFRGRKSAYLTIAGFAFGLLTVLGIEW
jgi:ABC-type transport system involved in cytochrome c biogenesis permease subunit